MLNTSDLFENAAKLCLKLGTTRVIDSQLNPRIKFINDIACGIKIHCGRQSVFMVASGAVALGRADAGYTADAELTTHEKQIAFGFGHQRHTRLFSDALENAGLKPATGHLVAVHNFDHPEQRDNLRISVQGLLDKGATVVFNENDLTSTAELELGKDRKWSDNDCLSAELSCVMGADLLIVMTDVDGVYTSHPLNGGVHIPQIDTITDEHLYMASGKGSGMSTGGMYSKLKAARIAQKSGITTIITKGEADTLGNLARGEAKCTIVPGFIRP